MDFSEHLDAPRPAAETAPVDNGRLLFPLQQSGSFAPLTPAADESAPGPGARWWPALSFALEKDEADSRPACIDRAKALGRPPETTR